MKRIAGPIVGVIAALAMAAPAQADISVDYCNASLRGGGSLAPDNDIKIVWDSIESFYTYDIVRSSLYRSRRDGPDNVYMQYFFYAADGTIIAYPDFRCYRDAGGTRTTTSIFTTTSSADLRDLARSQPPSRRSQRGWVNPSEW
jgi:hypothetical protein